ncbi:hypothetical protein ABPG72_016977 [Tetrahymena utriculariae]
MSVINYQSFQDLDQIDPFYLLNTNNQLSSNGNSSAPMWYQSSQNSQPLHTVSQVGIHEPYHLSQEQYENHSNNNYHDISFQKHNDNECTDLLSREIPSVAFVQPVPTSNKINAKQSSIQELLPTKEDQFFYSNQDSGNDIQNAQTRSNSFQSENQTCSASTIKLSNKMGNSVTHQTISDMKQGLEQSKNSYTDLSPHLPLSQTIYNDPYQHSSTSSCSSISLCCPPVQHNIQMNAENRGESRTDDAFHPQSCYYPQNLNNQPISSQMPYISDVEYNSYGAGYPHSIQEYNFNNKKCLIENSQNSFQMPQNGERAEQHAMKNYQQNNDKIQISNFNRYYEQDYQNSDNFKNIENVQQYQYSSNLNQCYYERSAQGNPRTANTSVSHPYFSGNPYSYGNYHSSFQNAIGQNYYNSFHFSQPAHFGYKLNQEKLNEVQGNLQQNYSRAQYNNQNSSFYNQNYSHKYYHGHFDPENNFDQEQNIDVEGKCNQAEIHHQQYQPAYQNHFNPQYGAYPAGGHVKFIRNQKYEGVPKDKHNNGLFYNALNNTTLPVSSTGSQIIKSEQDTSNNFQPELNRLKSQQTNGVDQRQIKLISQPQNSIQSQRKFSNDQIPTNQKQASEDQPHSEISSRHRESIDTIVSGGNQSQDTLANKEITSMNFKNTKQETIFEDSQDECSSPGSAKHITVESARARAKTINIIRSPLPKKQNSSTSQKQTPKNSPTPKKVKRSLDITGSLEEDEEEKELRLKLEQVKIEKKLSIDTCSVDEDDEEDDEDGDNCGDNDSQENYPISKELLMLTQNKKNVVKNIMSAFKTFVLTWGDKKAIEQIYNSSNSSCEEIEDIQRKFKRYIGSKSFNHYSLRLLILHVNYGPIFKFFLEKFSTEWLENSKIKDTESHQKMIQFFLSCFEDIKIIDALRRHPKKKCRFS